MTFQLDPVQLDAVDIMLYERCGIITGPPGTGKTTILKEALRLMPLGTNAVCCAPTGKAARRIMEITGYPAGTIHRVLGATRSLGGWHFDYDENNPLPFGLLIIDESSMLESTLAAALLRAVDTSKTRVFFVGDVNQLPSIGPGQVFADIIDSGRIPVVNLQTVHRAAGESWVCTNAPRILEGEISLEPTLDFRFFAQSDPEKVRSQTIKLVTELLPAAGVTDVQLLTPMNRGTIGVEMFNNYIQDVVNPAQRMPDGAPEPVIRGRATGGTKYLIRPRDKVIATVNNYELMVFNGETGVVRDIKGASTFVEFDGREVEMNREQARTLRLSYALTIHKCVAGDTLVFTDRGIRRMDAIDQGTGVVAGVGGPLAWDQIVRRPTGELLKITTKRGYEVSVTPDHGLMAWTSSGYERVEARELTDGQWVRLRIGGHLEPVVLAALPPAPELPPRSKPIRFPTSMSADLAEWLGLMVADGTVFAGGVRLGKRHSDVVDRFESLTRSLFGRVSSRVPMAGGEAVELNSTALVEWLQLVGGLMPHQKRVPECILAGSRIAISSFLRGLFEDGSVALRGDTVDHVEWTTSDQELGRTVQTLLLGLGIPSSRACYRNQWRISIYGDGLSAFAEEVGFISRAKAQRLLLGWSDGKTKAVLPVLPAEIPHGQGDRSWQGNARFRGYVSVRIAEERGIALDRLGFVHDRIVRIERTTGPSYCLHVPGMHRFLQNGFDGWNSQGSEFEWVVVVCHSAHDNMWSRQLLYTAITRAKKGVMIVGDRAGVAKAVANNDPQHRYTSLHERLTT